MQRTQFGEMACSIARTADVIGEPWSPLIVRNIYMGMTRFDQLQQNLGISRKVLAERLRWLTGNGVLERREYSGKPPRYEYVLTVKGLELFEVLMVMVRWGDKWLAGEAGPAGALPAPRVRSDQPRRTALLRMRHADVCHRHRRAAWPRLSHARREHRTRRQLDPFERGAGRAAFR